jgi:5-methylcytosine-specific restriction endonuclease McrA
LRRDPNWVFYSIEDVLEKYGTDCHICEEPIDFNAPRKVGIEGWEKGLHLDHFIPLTKGGGDSIENIRPSHGICNIRKGNKLKFGAN